MRLARVRTTEGTVGVAVLADDGSAQLLDLSGSESVNSLADLLHSADPVAGVERLLASGATGLWAPGDYECLAPIDRQEVWAAGVTYKRSQVARMEESESAATH
ncbi:MAG: hypothetical protein CM1200mP2_32780 [Planctomycetaceae bacterium]|nr:MAG: hypothetical protein CM1200mP2_32780 [Planctomycetaceae bacterium]